MVLGVQSEATRRGIAPEDVQTVLGHHILADGCPFVYDYQRSHGSYLVDQATGREYVDFFSFFASAPLSHNHPKVQSPEFRAKMADIGLINPANSDVYTVALAEAIDTIAEVAIPASLPHLFFVAGGAPAVENALKAAFDWKVRKNLAAGKGEKGRQVIHFREAFHGRLGYTLSLTNTADPRKYMYFPRFDWPRIDNPKLTFPLTETSLERVEEAERRALAQIDAAFEQNPDDIACIIIEPIQCEGGDNHFRPEFLRELRRIADERDVLLILDEVQTGMGVTGTWWAFQQIGMEPDIIAFGKKAQVCGIAASRRLDEVERNVFVEGSRINSTWGGNLADYVRGQRYVEIIQEDNLLENIAVQGEYLLDSLRELARYKAICNVRGKGGLVAFDLESGDRRDQLIQDAREAGLLVLAAGNESVRLRPYMDVRREDIDEGLSRLESVLPAR